MSHVRRFDHVGLTVADLDVVTGFFVALGLEVEGRTFVEGEFLDTVCGIPGSRTEIVMLKPPGEGTRLELSSFVRPESVPGSPAAMANELGLRNVAFEVSDLQAAVDWAAKPHHARICRIVRGRDIPCEGCLASKPGGLMRSGARGSLCINRLGLRSFSVIDPARPRRRRWQTTSARSRCPASAWHCDVCLCRGR